MSRATLKTFEELTVEEQDSAIGILYQDVLGEVLNLRMLPLDDALARAAKRATQPGGRISPALMDWAWDTAGNIAADCYYAPHEGVKVVVL